MKPGDLIEWTYSQTGDLVFQYETFWSTPMNCWVSIGSRLVHILVSINDEHITWLNKEGIFYAQVDDSVNRTTLNHTGGVVPREKK